MLLSELDAEARRSSPPNVIDSCGALALIFRHPFNGQGFAAKGVSQVRQARCLEADADRCSARSTRAWVFR